VLSPPEVALPHPVAQKSRGPRPSIAEAWRAILLLLGSVTEDRFWSERWTTSERVLSQLADWLRRSRAVRSIEIDEGWSDDRDLSVPVGRWAWLDARALVEDHGGGKSMLRVSTHLRPTMLGVVSALLLGLALFGAAAFGLALRWPAAGAISGGLTIVVIAAALWRTARATAVLRRSLRRVTLDHGMVQLPSGPVRPPIVTPSLLRMYGLRSATIFAVMILSLGASTLMLREAAIGPVIGGQKGYAGDYGPAIEAWLDTPGGVAVASNGDVYIADTNNHLIRRIDARTSNIEPVAGNHMAGSGFSGDNGLAIEAQLDTPNGVALAPDGDLIIADSHNQRIRRVDRATGIITTIAGSGETGYDGDGRPALLAALNTPSAVAAASNGNIYIADTLNYRVRMIDARTGLIYTVAGNGRAGDTVNVGDGGPALNATLNMPSDVAIDPVSGDLYIADMHHNRIRRVDAQTHTITTVAGGAWGDSGDDGPATEARLAGPAGVSIVSEPNGKVTIFIADYYNGRVRAVGPDGIIRDLSDDGRQAFAAPSRVAFATAGPRRGWLYVADSGQDKIVPLIIPRIAPNLAQAPPVRQPEARRVGG
jgi:DNA-binding beta-propeller fold protein YncE